MSRILKIFFCEWTEWELKDKELCFCPCHTEPGIYPTTEKDPCHHCQHVNEFGYMPWSIRDGWVEYWRSDKADTYATR